MYLEKLIMRTSTVIFSRTEMRLSGLHFPRSYFLLFIDGQYIWPFLIIYGFLWTPESFRNSRQWLWNNGKKSFDASHLVQHTCMCGAGRGHLEIQTLLHLLWFTICFDFFTQRLRGGHDLWRVRQRFFIYLSRVTDWSCLPVEVIAMQIIVMALTALSLIK